MSKNNKKTHVDLDLAAEEERCEQEADAVLNFLTLDKCINASTPDFVTNAVIDAIDEAGERFGFPTPTFAPEENEAEQRRMLSDLFSQTPFYSGRPDDKQKVLRALSELLHNPETPADLYEAVAGFVTDQSNQCGENLYHSDVYLTEVLKSVRPEDRIGAIQAREAERGGAQ